MIAWVLVKQRALWVAGVFASEDDADACLAALHGEVRAVSRVESRPDLAFPCFATDDHRGIRFLSGQEVAAELAQSAADRRDDEWCYTNLYRIDREFISSCPGHDDMGRLPHWHIDNQHLDQIQRGGLAALWSH